MPIRRVGAVFRFNFSMHETLSTKRISRLFNQLDHSSPSFRKGLGVGAVFCFNFSIPKNSFNKFPFVNHSVTESQSPFSFRKGLGVGAVFRFNLSIPQNLFGRLYQLVVRSPDHSSPFLQEGARGRCL
jgi:hypothetical protein